MKNSASTTEVLTNAQPFVAVDGDVSNQFSLTTDRIGVELVMCSMRRLLFSYAIRLLTQTDKAPNYDKFGLVHYCSPCRHRMGLG